MVLVALIPCYPGLLVQLGLQRFLWRKITSTGMSSSYLIFNFQVLRILWSLLTPIDEEIGIGVQNAQLPKNLSWTEMPAIRRHQQISYNLALRREREFRRDREPKQRSNWLCQASLSRNDPSQYEVWCCDFLLKATRYRGLHFCAS
jgi:hypothetical protein